MNKEVYYIALHLAKGLGPKKKIELLNHYGSIESLFHTNKSDLKSKIVKENDLTDNQDKLIQSAQNEVQKCKDLGIEYVYIQDSNYPQNLKVIPDPPIVLFYKGTLSENDFNSIAVVGSRDVSETGLRNSKHLSEDLAGLGVTIVSGLALGIDKAAHEGVLNKDGRTIAVLGCGLDKYYPSQNRNLQDEIAKTGCLISEYPIGTEPLGRNFPIRNRIIAGLSVGVVVVEGSVDSGSLYTAKFALEYGRELYAFPGPANNPNYSGNHNLIKKGAKLIENSMDLLEDLSLVLDLDFQKIKPEYKPKKKIEVVEEEVSLPTDEFTIYSCLSDEKYTHIDIIVEETGLSIEKVMFNLTSLVLKDCCLQKGNDYKQNVRKGVIVNVK